MADGNEKSPILDTLKGGAKAVAGVLLAAGVTAVLVAIVKGQRVDLRAWIVILIGVALLAIIVALEWRRVRQVKRLNVTINRLEGAAEEARRAAGKAEGEARRVSAEKQEPMLGTRSRELLASLDSIRPRQGRAWDHFEVEGDETERFDRLVSRAFAMLGGVPRSVDKVVQNAAKSARSTHTSMRLTRSSKSYGHSELGTTIKGPRRRAGATTS